MLAQHMQKNKYKYSQPTYQRIISGAREAYNVNSKLCYTGRTVIHAHHKLEVYEDKSYKLHLDFRSIQRMCTASWHGYALRAQF